MTTPNGPEGRDQHEWRDRERREADRELRDLRSEIQMLAVTNANVLARLKSLEDNFVGRQEFISVKVLAWGAAGIIFSGFFIALVRVVWIGAKP